MKRLILFGLLLSSVLSYSQIRFQKTLGGSLLDYGTDIKSTSDGGFIIAGYGQSYTSGNDDYYLIKTDAFGNEEWARSIGYSTDPDRADEVVIMTDGSYAIGGSTWLGINSVMISRFDQMGNNLWTSFFEGNTCTGYFTDMIATDDTGLVVLSETCNLSCLTRYNKNGDTLWTSIFATSSFNPWKVIQNHNGNYMIMGCDPGSSATDGIYLIEVSAAGDSLWTKTYHTPLGFGGIDIIQSSDSCYYITGHANAGVVTDVLLLKIDKNGSSLWSKTYTGSSNDGAFAIIEDMSGNIVILGQTYTFSTGSNWDLMLTKTDTAGNLLWSKAYGGNSQEYSYSIIQESDSGYVLMGSTYTYGQGGGDIYFLRTDLDGFSGCHEQIATPGVSSLGITEIPSAIARYYLNTPAYHGTPTISNITFTAGEECFDLAAITHQTDVSCYGQCNGVGICIADGGTPPYSFYWNDPSAQANDTATGLCPGTYQVMIVDNINDTVYQTVVISEPPELIISTSGDTTICNGESIDISASGASTYVWWWYNGTGTGPTVSVTPDSTTTYNIIGADANLCTDTTQLTVTVNTVDTSITCITYSAFANDPTATYQWVDCDNSFAPVPWGGTNQYFYNDINTGNYAVIITNNGCTDTSYCCFIDFIENISDHFQNNDVVIYPNPTSGKITVEMRDIVNIEVMNLQGKEIYKGKENEIDLSSQANGIYIIKVVTDNQIITKKLIKH